MPHDCLATPRNDNSQRSSQRAHNTSQLQKTAINQARNVKLATPNSQLPRNASQPQKTALATPRNIPPIYYVYMGAPIDGGRPSQKRKRRAEHFGSRNQLDPRARNGMSFGADRTSFGIPKRQRLQLAFSHRAGGLCLLSRAPLSTVRRAKKLGASFRPNGLGAILGRDKTATSAIGGTGFPSRVAMSRVSQCR